MVRLRTVVFVTLGLVAIAGVCLNELFRETVIPATLSPAHVAALQAFETEAPASLLKADGTYHFGRWKNPVKDITLAHEVASTTASSSSSAGVVKKARDFLKQKHWEYFSLVDQDFFLSFSIIQFNYVEDIVVNLVELKNPEKKYEFLARRIPAMGVEVADSSARGCSSFSRDLMHLDVKDISVCFKDDEQIYEILINVPLTGPGGDIKPLHASFAVSAQESLVISFPLAGSLTRPAYVHKSAGMDTVGSLKFGESAEKHHFRGHAALDWTKSMALRSTTWNWVSVSGNAVVKTHTKSEDGKVTTETSQGEFGINLSAKVYDIKGESVENGVWLNHTVYALGGVSFEVPEHPLKESWKIFSMYPSAFQTLDLTFVPKGCREDHTNLGLVVSEFVQPFGYFSGVVKIAVSKSVVQEIIIDKAFGVVEDHVAVW